MAWSYRRSRRLPFGFRVNVSKSGVGYSWGFRGFRIGKDSKGRVVRTLSIPGTGLFNRQYLNPQSSCATTQQSVNSNQANGFGRYSLVGLLSLLAGGSTHSVSAFLVVFGVGIAAVRMLSLNRRSVQSTAPSTSTERTNTFRGLGFQAVQLHLELKSHLKNEMQRLHIASQFDEYFDSDLSHVLFHFATVDGPANPIAGLLCLEVLGAIHPKRWQGFTIENAAELINRVAFDSVSTIRTLKEPTLIRIARSADGNGQYHLTEVLGTFFYELANESASTDGPLSAQKKNELETFRGILELCSRLPLHNELQEATLELPAGRTQAISVPVTEKACLSTSSPVDVFTSECGESLRAFVSKINSFLAEIEPPLKSELRKVRSAGNSRDFLETDIRNLIIRVGVSGSNVTRAAAQLHLELFRSWHPKKFAWTLEQTTAFMRDIFARMPEEYSGPLPKPLVLTLMDSFDSKNGTGYATQLRNIYYRVACYADNGNDGETSKSSPILETLKRGLEL